MNYYAQKERQIRKDIYEILTKTNDKHEATAEIMLLMKDKINAISDMANENKM